MSVGVRQMSGILYVVATPIGNLADITERARQVLASVAVVAAEDTRHTGQLLAQYGISAPLFALHEHNESERSEVLIRRLKAGEDVAVVSDAGTPLISDPGYRLVSAAASEQIRIVPIPGACAAITALSVAGLPTDRFIFEGFLPHKGAARRTRLEELAGETRTLVFYESPHRLAETLQDLAGKFGADRWTVIARELTKLHESLYRGTAAQLAALAAEDANLSRGECVIAVAGADAESPADDLTVHEGAIRMLLEHAPLSVVADAVSQLTGIRRNAVYDRALALRRLADHESS
jgi:16S rRNA (cytidine1402-2'-O)-methyltransferase